MKKSLSSTLPSKFSSTFSSLFSPLFAPLLSSLLGLALFLSPASALPFVDIEAGVSLGADLRDGGYLKKSPTQGQLNNDLSSISFSNASITNTRLAYGFYGRVWIDPLIPFLRIAPSLRYDSTLGLSSVSANSNEEINYSLTRYQNAQYGLLLGFEIPVVSLTPYVGASYSQFFNSDLGNAIALNYGIKWAIPLTFLTLGLDGSFQRPLVSGSTKTATINRLQLTIGLEF